ncbi:UVI-1 [Xylaria flabelliformis]|nr:UVI-1 [Xylaria flabelliformis]
MLVSKILTGIAMACTAMAAATPQQIADGIGSITQKSQALQAPAQSLTTVDAVLFPIGQGAIPGIINDFSDIVSTASALAALLPGTPPITKRDEREHTRDISARGPDADLVFNAFRAFVRVHQELLNILIGKAGIFTLFPFVGPPVAAALRGVEGVVDTITIALIGLLQDHVDDLTAEGNSLTDTLDLAIQSYANL